VKSGAIGQDSHCRAKPLGNPCTGADSDIGRTPRAAMRILADQPATNGAVPFYRSCIADRRRQDPPIGLREKNYPRRASSTVTQTANKMKAPLRTGIALSSSLVALLRATRAKDACFRRMEPAPEGGVLSPVEEAVASRGIVRPMTRNMVPVESTDIQGTTRYLLQEIVTGPWLG